jgi:hypothetical protein
MEPLEIKGVEKEPLTFDLESEEINVPGVKVNTSIENIEDFQIPDITEQKDIEKLKSKRLRKQYKNQIIPPYQAEKEYKYKPLIPEYSCSNENDFLLESVPKSENENYLLDKSRTFEIINENDLNIDGQKNEKNWNDLIKIDNDSLVVKGKSKAPLQIDNNKEVIEIKKQINKWDDLIDDKTEDVNIKGQQIKKNVFDIESENIELKGKEKKSFKIDEQNEVIEFIGKDNISKWNELNDVENGELLNLKGKNKSPLQIENNNDVIQIDGQPQKSKWGELNDIENEVIDINGIEKPDWNQLNDIEGEDILINGQENPKISNWNDINDMEGEQLFIKNTYKQPENWNDKLKKQKVDDINYNKNIQTINLQPKKTGLLEGSDSDDVIENDDDYGQNDHSQKLKQKSGQRDVLIEITKKGNQNNLNDNDDIDVLNSTHAHKKTGKKFENSFQNIKKKIENKSKSGSQPKDIILEEKSNRPSVEDKKLLEEENIIENNEEAENIYKNKNLNQTYKPSNRYSYNEPIGRDFKTSTSQARRSVAGPENVNKRFSESQNIQSLLRKQAGNKKAEYLREFKDDKEEF